MSLNDSLPPSAPRSERSYDQHCIGLIASALCSVGNNGVELTRPRVRVRVRVRKPPELTRPRVRVRVRVRKPPELTRPRVRVRVRKPPELTRPRVRVRVRKPPELTRPRVRVRVRVRLRRISEIVDIDHFTPMRTYL